MKKTFSRWLSSLDFWAPNQSQKARNKQSKLLPTYDLLLRSFFFFLPEALSFRNPTKNVFQRPLAVSREPGLSLFGRSKIKSNAAENIMFTRTSMSLHNGFWNLWEEDEYITLTKQLFQNFRAWFGLKKPKKQKTIEASCHIHTIQVFFLLFFHILD